MHFKNGVFGMWQMWIFGAQKIVTHFFHINLNKYIKEATFGKVNFYRDRRDATDSLCINFQSNILRYHVEKSKETWKWSDNCVGPTTGESPLVQRAGPGN